MTEELEIKEIDNNKKMISNPDDESPTIRPNPLEVFIKIPSLKKRPLLNNNEIYVEIPSEKQNRYNFIGINESAPIRTSSNNETEGSNKIEENNIRADLVNIDVNLTEEEKNEERAEKLIDLIKTNKKKITNNLYIISCKYDIIYYRYNSISLSLLIISTIITFIEAIRLTLINYDTQYKESQISKYISQDTITLIINCVSLSLSTILTILSSIARFKNYKENMDKLKIIHDTLFNYKNLYDREKDLINYYKINKELNEEVFKKIQDTIDEYSKEIKNINIFENIRNTDIIKFNNIKVNHDLRLQQLASKREIELLRINKSTEKKKEEINNNDYKTLNCCGII